MAVVCDDYAYAKEWTSKASRGGLFKVNDTCFVFFCSIEPRTQLCLPQLLNQQSIEEAVMKSIEEDDSDSFAGVCCPLILMIAFSDIFPILYTLFPLASSDNSPLSHCIKYYA